VYQAFLSYSHRADAVVAPILQRALERIGTPFWRRAGIRVFRDDASLPASPALWPSIEAGLAKSAHLVLLASPASAESVWVDREVRWWLEHRRAEGLLIVVTAGEIAYDETTSDFDWQRTTCLPPALRGVFKAEPHWTDLRFATGPEHRTLRNSGFRSAALSVAAAIRGVAKDDLENEDVRQHRRSVALLTVLALATAVAVYIARSESESASTNLKEAESRRLAAEALIDLEQDRGVEAATLKATIAWRLAPTQEARRALRRIDETTPDIARVLGQHTGSPRAIAFSRDGSRLATAGDDGVVLQWSVADGRPWGSPLSSERQSVHQLLFSADGSHLLVNGRREGESGLPAVAVLRLRDGKHLATETGWLETLRSGGKTHDTVCAAISPSGARLAVADGRILVVVELASATTVAHPLPANTHVTAIAFAGETHVNFVVDDDYGGWSRAGFVNTQRAAPTLGAKANNMRGQCGFTSFSDDGSHLAVLSDMEGLGFWKIEGANLKQLPHPEAAPRPDELTGHLAPAWDATGNRVAFGVRGTTYVWDLAARQIVKTVKPAGYGPPLALSPDGRLLAVIHDGTPIVWRLDREEHVTSIAGTRCGESLDDKCIERLCERITAQRDERRWRELLGDRYAVLLSALQGTRCSSG